MNRILCNLTRAATAALLIGAMAASPAQARRVAIDLGDSNFDSFGTTWMPPVKQDVSHDGCFGDGVTCTAASLPFAINFGSGLVDSVFIYENGFVTFGTAIAPGNLGIQSLADFTADFIAPAYGDIISNPPQGTGYTFDNPEVSYALGSADFTGPPYDVADIAPNSILDVTWNNVLAASDGVDSFKTYQFQILFLNAQAFDPNAQLGDFDLSLNFGTVLPKDVLTGFKLGSTTINIDPSTVLGRQSQDFVYSFRGGVLAGSAPVAAVPESSTWAMMIIGFGAVGSSLRVKSRKDKARKMALAAA